MVSETAKMLDDLSAALGRARSRREPGHVASLRALDAIAAAVAATRAFAEAELVLIDGSRSSARLGELSKLWQKAQQAVLGLSIEGDEKSLLRGESWHKTERWKKLEKPAGWLWIKGLLGHCEWLLSGLPEPGEH